jgi:hypothetical protein
MPAQRGRRAHLFGVRPISARCLARHPCRQARRDGLPVPRRKQGESPPCFLRRHPINADGGGLYLRVTPEGAKSWVYRFMLNRKARSMGLGPTSLYGLQEARLTQRGPDASDGRRDASRCYRQACQGIPRRLRARPSSMQLFTDSFVGRGCKTSPNFAAVTPVVTLSALSD